MLSDTSETIPFKEDWFQTIRTSKNDNLTYSGLTVSNYDSLIPTVRKLGIDFSKPSTTTGVAQAFGDETFLRKKLLPTNEPFNGIKRDYKSILSRINENSTKKFNGTDEEHRIALVEGERLLGEIHLNERFKKVAKTIDESHPSHVPIIWKNFVTKLDLENSTRFSHSKLFDFDTIERNKEQRDVLKTLHYSDDGGTIFPHHSQIEGSRYRSRKSIIDALDSESSRITNTNKDTRRKVANFNIVASRNDSKLAALIDRPEPVFKEDTYPINVYSQKWTYEPGERLDIIGRVDQSKLNHQNPTSLSTATKFGFISDASHRYLNGYGGARVAPDVPAYDIKTATTSPQIKTADIPNSAPLQQLNNRRLNYDLFRRKILSKDIQAQFFEKKGDGEYDIKANEAKAGTEEAFDQELNRIRDLDSKWGKLDLTIGNTNDFEIYKDISSASIDFPTPLAGEKDFKIRSQDSDSIKKKLHFQLR